MKKLLKKIYRKIGIERAMSAANIFATLLLLSWALFVILEIIRSPMINWQSKKLPAQPIPETFKLEEAKQLLEISN